MFRREHVNKIYDRLLEDTTALCHGQFMIWQTPSSSLVLPGPIAWCAIGSLVSDLSLVGSCERVPPK